MLSKLYYNVCLYLFGQYNRLDIQVQTQRMGGACLFICGCVILTIGLNMAAMGQTGDAIGSGTGEAGDIIKKQLCKIMQLLQGPFGALVTVVAGLAAVVTAAMGGYKLAMSCVVIACGTYIIEAFTKLFFDGALEGCEGLSGSKNNV